MSRAWPIVLSVVAGAELAAQIWFRHGSFETSATQTLRAFETRDRRLRDPGFRRVLRPPRYVALEPPPPAPAIKWHQSKSRNVSSGIPSFPPRPDLPLTARSVDTGARVRTSDHSVRPTHRVEPIPPSGWSGEGRCDLRFDIGLDGRAHAIRVIRSTDPQIDHACTVAVSQWLFAPEVVDGVYIERSGVRSRVHVRTAEAGTDKRR